MNAGNRRRQKTVAKQLQKLASIVVAVVPGFFAQYWNRIEPYLSAAVKAVSEFIVAYFGVFVFQTLSLLSIATTGLLLYMFRCRYLKIYGWLEVGVGIATALYLANTLNDPRGSSFGPYFAVIASLYVIVRGLDNLHKSLKDERYVALWNRFFFGIKPEKESP